MRAVSSGYGDITPVSEVAVTDGVISPSGVPEPEEVAVVTEATTKKSSRSKAALASVLGAIGLGATPFLGL